MDTSRMTLRYAHWLLRHRWWVVMATVLLVAAAGAGGSRLHFTNDYRVFFSKENPQLRAFQELENSYTKDDNVLLVLAPKNNNVFTAATLAAVEQITREAWQIPHSIRVDSLSNFQYTYAQGDELVVQDLVRDSDKLSAKQLQHIREIALNEPLLVNRLVSPQAHVTGINVTVQLPGKQPMLEGPQVVEHVRELAAKVRAEHPELRLYITGMVMMNQAFSEAAQGDMQHLLPITFLVILVSIGLLLRAWSSTFITFWVIVFSIMTAMGLAGWVGIKLTPPSASAPTIILTLAVANAVHILVTFVQAMRKGMEKLDAMVESLRVNMQPVFLTSITTAIGFLSMNFSDAPPFRDLGNIVAIGMLAAFVFAVTFLPAAVTLLPVHIKAGHQEQNKFMHRLADFVLQYRTALLWGMALVIITLVAMIPRNELNDTFVEYFDQRVEFRRDSDFIAQNLGGLYRVDYSLRANESGGVSNPAFLRQVQAFAKWYSGRDEVIHVNTFTDIMQRLNKNMHGDDTAYYRLPQARDLAAQYLLLYEMSLPYGLDLNNQINVDKSATRMSVTLKSLSVREFLHLEKQAQEWLSANAPQIQVDGASPTVMFSHISQRNIRSMLLGTSLALVLISLILVFALRSIKIGFISLVPNLVPAAMGFGLWGMLVGEVGIAISVVMGMTLGIVVDDTVHFLSKYLRARREHGTNSEEAVRYAFHTVGTALGVTSMVLVAGFLILAWSSFKMNSDMGLLTAATIGFALLADFLFLPPLLMKFDKAARHAPVLATAEAGAEA